MKNLWDKNTEIEFFKNSLKLTTPEQLFYKTSDERFLAYWPKGYKGPKSTLQSRNTFIGDFTEKWALNILNDFAEKMVILQYKA